MELEINAYAKINLALDVLKKREDGYHDVRMVMQTIGLYDVLKMTDIDEDLVEIKSNRKIVSVDADNIAYKACMLIKEEYGINRGVKIYIEKNIPIAAGMAGGSTDAAAALIGMNKLFNLGISKEKLMEYGARLGADVPYCIMQGTALAEGIGEKLTRLSPLPKCYILIAKPPISISTKKVYQKLNLNEISHHPDIDKMIEALNDGDLKGVADTMENVLELVTAKSNDAIWELKVLMRQAGALNQMMTGSGPTVFGIFEDEEKAKAAAEKIIDKKFANSVFVVEPVNVSE